MLENREGYASMDQECSNASGAPGGSVVQVCFPGVRAAVLDSLNRQREEGRLCDLSIQVQGQVFRAHRCVLAASSPYFHDQVLLKNVTTVSLPAVMDPLAFESVLGSAYTGQLSIVRDDIVNYVTVASFLQMWHIVDKCTEILKRPRAAGGGGGGGGNPQNAPSRQQSPSSTDCLYLERERSDKLRGAELKERGGAERERGQDQGHSLPPLASWRRPQQLSRWGRPRPQPQAALPPPPSGVPQPSADSQLDSNAGGESDYSSCEEVWLPGSSKASPHGHDSGGHAHSRAGLDHGVGGGHFSGGHPAEASRLRGRTRPRGAPNFPLEDFQKLLGRGREKGSGDVEEGEGLAGRVEEPKRKRERGTEADEGMGEAVEEGGMDGTERTGHSGEYPTSVYHGDEVEVMEARDGTEGAQKVGRRVESRPPHSLEVEAAVPGPSCPGPPLSARMQWQASPWIQSAGRALDGGGEEEDDDEEEEEADFGRFADEGGPAFGGQTYDEIEDGTGQVSQRPLVPASPTDDADYLLGPPELSWPPPNIAPQGPGGAMAPGRHQSPSSAQFPPSSSPPIPSSSSSSSLSLAGAPYTGKVHFCHCGKAYTLKSMRDRHVKMQHLNLRPFACPVCAKTFKMKHHLTKHLKTHGGLRPYECGLCGKKVIWRDSFLRHQARCERLAAAGMAPGYDGAAAVAGGSGNGNGPGANGNDLDDGYGYGFEEGEGFLAEAGQVKVEEADFQGEAESVAMGGLLEGVSVGGGLSLGPESRTVGGRGLKEEEGERYS
ncbi:zinc finger and BTB domain-containing protein 43 isoform X2 [Anguilla rostrata]|uniref:zinc finger and BTB domain-containing protein 43 isoform X2 n=1 Tax=Anguilla rostrata TaxID=7938 RepID=UPI0030D4CF6F